MPNMEAITVARIFVNEFICRFGVPEQLHTDQGRNFESALLKEICKLLGITKTRTTPYHPQSNGMIERFNGTILNMLSMVVLDDEHNWDLHLPTLMMAYRTSRHETTGATPFSLVYGREAKLPEDILFNLPSVEVTNSHGYAEALKEHIQHAYQRVRDHSAVEQKKQKVNYDRFTQGNSFPNGSLVWLHCPAVPRGKSFIALDKAHSKLLRKLGMWYTASNMCKTRENELLYMPTDSRDTTVRKTMNTLKRTGSFCRVWKSKSIKLFLLYKLPSRT